MGKYSSHMAKLSLVRIWFFAVNNQTTNQNIQANGLLTAAIDKDFMHLEAPLAIPEDLADSESEEIKVVTEESQTSDTNSSKMYLLSTLSGPLLTCAVASMYIYVPTHSILKEPLYWYEHELLTMIAALLALYGLTILHGKLEF